MNFLELAKKRYSCRSFSDKEVEKEKLDAILEAGQIAPTGKNAQPWKAWVFTGSALEKFQAVSKLAYKTPIAILVGSNPEEAYVRPYDNANFSDVDASIVVTHMMLEVEEKELATVWVGHFDSKAIQEEYPETSKYHLIAILPIGYASETAEPSPRHFETKALEDLYDFKR